MIVVLITHEKLFFNFLTKHAHKEPCPILEPLSILEPCVHLQAISQPAHAHSKLGLFTIRNVTVMIASTFQIKKQVGKKMFIKSACQIVPLSILQVPFSD